MLIGYATFTFTFYFTFSFTFSEGGLSFVLIGYALAFGSGNIFIGYSHFLILDLDPSGYAFFFFQVFCNSSLENNSSLDNNSSR